MNIGVNNGIPASESYNVMQDSKGYIWFSTEGGVCKFDGTNIKVYSGNEGLSEKACYGIYEHPKGKIWFITSKNRVLLYDEKNDRMVESGFSKKLKSEIDKNPLSQLYLIQAYNDSTLWLCAQLTTFKVNIYTNKVDIVTPENDSIYTFINHQHNLLPLKFENRKSSQDLKKNEIQIKIINSDTLYRKIKWKKDILPQWRCLTAKNAKGECFIGWDNYLVKIKKNNDCEVYTTINTILSIYVDKSNRLWVGTLKGGLLSFINSDLKNPIHSLGELSVTGTCEDYERGIWCSTLEKGIFYCRSKAIVCYSNINGLNKKLEFFNVIDTTLYGNIDGKNLICFSGNKITSYHLDIDGGYVIRDMIAYKKGYLIASYDGIAYAEEDFSKITFFRRTGSKQKCGATDIIKDDKGRIFFIQNGTLFELLKDKEIVVRVPVFKSGANCFLEYGDSLLLGCRDGLYIISIRDFNIRKNETVTGSVVDIHKSKTNEIWVTTKYNGVFLSADGRFTNISKQLKLNNSRLFDMCEDKDSTIWIAGSTGLIKIRNKSSVVYNTNNGLPSNEVYNVACADNKIYFNTAEGVCSFGMEDELKNTSSPYIYLDKIFVNDNTIPEKANHPLIFKYFENNLRFKFDALSFKNYGNVHLLIKMKGFNDTLKYINGNELVYNNLNPGNYELTVYALNNDNLKSKKPVIIKFEILKPFWETAWFIISCIFLIVLLFFVIIRLITIRIKKKEKEKNRINNLIVEYQLTALQAQMNPHFIFNAINSIHSFILENETQAAYDYLAKFAKLVRMVLNNAKERTITLEKEIELLKIYVELEQMRFENKFDIEYIVDNEIDISKHELPPMLIQPYVENAIWHGLMPLNKTRKGKLKVEIKKTESYVIIVVEDNGIGRARSKEIRKSSEHTSLGMELTENRIRVMNSISENGKAMIVVIDLQNENKEACGTRVEVYVPFLTGDYNRYL